MIRQEHISVTRSARYAVLGEEQPEDLDEIWFVCHGYRQLAARFVRNFEPLVNGHRLIIAPEGLNRFYLDDGTGPHGPESRVGATWMTREDREGEIRDYVEYLDTLFSHILAPAAALNERSFSEAEVEGERATRATGGRERAARAAMERERAATEHGRPATDPERATRDGIRVRVLGFSQGAATVSRWAAYGHARIDHLILWSGLPAHDLDVSGAAERLGRMDLTLVLGSADAFTKPERAKHKVEELSGAGIPARLVTFDGGHRLDHAVLERLASE